MFLLIINYKKTSCSFSKHNWFAFNDNTGHHCKGKEIFHSNVELTFASKSHQPT